MAGTELTPQQLTRLGVFANAQAITGTGLSTANFFNNTGNEVLLLTHTSGGGTVYAQITQRIDNELPSPKSANITDAALHIFGPFPVEQYSDVVLIWGNDANLTAEIVRVS